VRESVASVDAALDAAGRGGLSDAVSLAGGPTRVITLADTNAADLGVAFSVGTPDRAPEALDVTMGLLASGALRLRRQRHLPMEQAAEAHRLLEKDETHEKFILDAP
jgi:NADPH:quinone reductase-like Zn-dependent oxidoreductase